MSPYISNMSTVSAPLMTRLRRYLRVVAVLCLGLVLMKSVFASSCTVDRLVSESQTSVLVAVVDHGVPGDAGNCWHDGTGGCHCVCAHVTPLPLQATTLRLSPASAGDCVLAVDGGPPAPLDDHLRPPIA